MSEEAKNMEANAQASNDMCMGWDDTIENDGKEFTVLPEGDYNFTVTGFERGRFPGSAKLPACNKASLTLSVETQDGTATVKTDLILYRTLEWRLASFFRCIGLKKHGEKLVMDWSKVVGSVGRAHFKPRNYKDKDGNDRQANDVDKFLDYNPADYGIDENGFMKIPKDVDEELPFS